MPERLVFSAFIPSFKDLVWEEDVSSMAQGKLRFFRSQLTKAIGLRVAIFPFLDDAPNLEGPSLNFKEYVNIKECMTDEASYSLTVWGTDPEETKLRAYTAGRKKFLEILEAHYGATLEAPKDPALNPRAEANGVIDTLDEMLAAGAFERAGAALHSMNPQKMAPEAISAALLTTYPAKDVLGSIRDAFAQRAATALRVTHGWSTERVDALMKRLG